MASRSDRPSKGLEHHHRGDHIGRYRGAAPVRREQISKHRIGEQPAAMFSQKRVHRTGRDQMPHHDTGV